MKSRARDGRARRVAASDRSSCRFMCGLVAAGPSSLAVSGLEIKMRDGRTCCPFIT